MDEPEIHRPEEVDMSKKKAAISDETRDTIYRMYTRGAMPETMAATFGIELAEVDAVIEKRFETLALSRPRILSATSWSTS